MFAFGDRRSRGTFSGREASCLCLVGVSNLEVLAGAGVVGDFRISSFSLQCLFGFGVDSKDGFSVFLYRKAVFSIFLKFSTYFV